MGGALLHKEGQTKNEALRKLRIEISRAEKIGWTARSPVSAEFSQERKVWTAFTWYHA